jgi:predicted pyridoxine 5'-phosphate oxidase superfamily flavin-nucleotide-binding protein
MEFSDVVQSEAELRELMGDPVAPPVVSPFVLISSSDNKGRMDISPKGDAPGFVKILDDKTLAIPDRPGNQRFDTFSNLFQSPRVGMIFLIPGKRETLRVGGSAQIVRDSELLQSMAVTHTGAASARIGEIVSELC